MLFSLPAHAHELAGMANRRTPSTRDFYTAMQQCGPRLMPNELEQYVRDVDLEDVDWRKDIRAEERQPSWCDPYEGCLPSESEDDSAVEEEKKETGVVGTRSRASRTTTARKRRRKKFKVEMAEVPDHFPPLPPKHTWLSTPSYPAHSINLQPPLAFLDRKVSSNRLMEASLRGLIRATDAAVLDSQLQHGIQHGEGTQLDTEGFDSARLQADGRTAASPQITTFATPSRPLHNASSNETNEDDSQRIKLKKGRTLSLRLRTPSVSQVVPQMQAINSQESIQTPLFKKPLGTSHRLSMSLAGPQSAFLPNVASHARRNTFASGPWSASTSQTQFNWTSISTTDMMSPLATPLTPGLSFNYPPTPSEAYANEVLSKEVGQQFDQNDSAPIGLPTTVNYKRTWYKKKSNSKAISSTAMTNQKQIRS